LRPILPICASTVTLAAGFDGVLQAIVHEAVAGTSHYEDYQENTVNWSGLLYHCPNVRLSYMSATRQHRPAWPDANRRSIP
jgi:xanthine dehydrogenase YagR molybdenum-binding subunit